MRSAVFLDRDGVLNRTVMRDGRAASPRALGEFHLLPGVRAAAETLDAAGLLAIVVTNQPDLARGRLDCAELDRMHEHLCKHVRVAAIYICPHDDADGCACRKPKPGLLLRAARDWNIRLEQSWMVGDTGKDIEAGKAASCTTLWIGSDPDSARTAPDFVASDFPAAARAILQQLRRRRRFALARSEAGARQ